MASPLRSEITTESWMEDLIFAQGAFSKSRPQSEAESAVRDYLAHRYIAPTATLEYFVLQASHNWLVRNTDELAQLGLRVHNENGTGYVNALLFALHNLVFRDPHPSWWDQVPDQPLGPVVSEAQTFINAEKTKKENKSEQGDA